LPLLYVQGGDLVTLFPVIKASEFVAGQSLFAFALDTGDSSASAGSVKDHGNAFSDLRDRDGRCVFFSATSFRRQACAQPSSNKLARDMMTQVIEFEWVGDLVLLSVGRKRKQPSEKPALRG
jgi:hypothetical protein